MLKKSLVKLIEMFLILTGLVTIITLSWRVLEAAIIGEITPSKVDSIVAVILTVSLYTHLQNAKQLKEEKNDDRKTNIDGT